MPIIATSSTPPDAQYQVPALGLVPGSPSLRRRSSEVGNVFDAQNAQKFDFRSQYPIGNQRPVPNAYAPNGQWSGPSPVTSVTQYPSAGAANVDMIPGMSSSDMHIGSVTSLNHLDTSGLQDNVYNCSPIILGPASSGALPQIEDQNPPQGTSSMALESPSKKRRTGGRKHPALENQPIPSAYPPYPGWSGASQATSGAQYSAAGPSHTVPGPSSHTHPVAFPPVMDSFPSPSSSGLQNDLYDNVGIIPLIPESEPNDGDLSQTEGYDFSQQSASPAATSNERRKVRRAGKRKRKDDPKDKKGTERLRDQRQTDADNLEKLCEILGAPEAQKKDLFAICTSQSYYLSWTMDECCQWLYRPERCGTP